MIIEMRTYKTKPDLWKGELENVLMPMLEKYELVVVEDPDHLIRWQPA